MSRDFSRSVTASFPAISQSVARSIILFAGVAWCSCILAAPVFHWRFAYQLFSTICHQMPSRSWHLYGEQFGLCIRCSAISFGFLAGLIANAKPRRSLLIAAIVAAAAQWLFSIIAVDSESLRILSGAFLGVVAAPFVQSGFQELFTRIGVTNENMP